MPLQSPISNLQSPISNLQSPAPCPHTITEKFIPGTEPARYDDWHQAIALDRRNGLRAGPDCSLDFIRLQIYTIYPAEATAWARKQGVPQPPSIYSPFCPNHQDAAASSGSEARPEFDGTQPGTFAPGEANGPGGGLVFTSPDQGTVFRLVPNIPVDKQKIRIAVYPVDGVQLKQVSLLVNGQRLVDGAETLWQMTPGIHTFAAVGLDQAGHTVRAREVTVEVVK